MRSRLVFRFSLAVLPLACTVGLSPASLRAGSRAIAVSPGAERAVPTVGGSCPTFSWAVADGAEGYELVVLDVAEPEHPRPVLKQRLVGGLGSWTPSGPQCLTAGGSYAWTIRALQVAGQPPPDDAAWSSPLRFRIPGQPTAEELAAALEVLERWQASGEAGDRGEARRGSAPVDRRSLGASNQAVEVSGTSAIRGENPAAAGANFGVTGQSGSSAGAGLVGINLASGPDLILDGVANGEADTSFSQSGIDRPSGAAQTFNVQNSGGGGMALQVQGTEVSLAGHAHAGQDITTGTINAARLPAEVSFVGHTHTGEEITAGTVADARIAATLARDSEVMPIVLANDGPGSGLDADTLGGVSAASFQLRVTGTCPAGQTMQGVNSNGSVVCAAFGAPPVITTVDDPVSSVGQYTSLAIGTDGFPVISYYDSTAFLIKVAKCNDVACTGGDETITADSKSINGHEPSLAIGIDGLPVISYYEPSSSNLWVAKCDDAACGGYSIAIVDEPGNVGRYSSIAIGIDNRPIISYLDGTAGALKVAHCGDLACSAGNTVTTLDNPAVNLVGQYTSIAIGADGFPVISYFDNTASDLKVAKCGNVQCSGGAAVTTVDSVNSVGQYTSIAIGTDGFPVISYSDNTAGALKVAKCDDAACLGGNETITTVDDPANAVGWYTSIAIGADGFPVISYWDITAGALEVAKCNDAACSSSRIITTVDDSANEVGSYTSIAIGTDGFPVISYHDSTAFVLKVAKCYTRSCFMP